MAFPAECRPIQVTAENETIPLQKCRNIWNEQSGYCLQKNSLIVLQDTCSMGQHAGSTQKPSMYTRQSKGAGWLLVLPGDSSSTSLTGLKESIVEIAIDGASIGSGPWRIELFAGDTIFVDTILTEPLTEGIELLLQQPLFEKHNDVQVRISIPSDSSAKVFIRRIEVKN